MSLPDFRPVEGSKLTDELSCSICLSVLNNPVELAECGHMYCYTCLFGRPIPSQGSPKTRSSTLPPSFDGSITQPFMTPADLSARPRVSTCPQCRTAVGKVKEPHRALKNLLGALDGSCTACPWRGTHSEFLRHAPCFRRGQPQTRNAGSACSSAPLPPPPPQHNYQQQSYHVQPNSSGSYACSSAPLPPPPQQHTYQHQQPQPYQQPQQQYPQPQPQPSFGSFPVLQQDSSASFPSQPAPPAPTDGPLGVSNSGYYRNPFSGSLMKNQHAR